MKQTLKILWIAFLVLGVFISADAQRTREFKSDNSNRGPRRPAATNYSPARSSPARTFNNNDRSVTYRSEERNSSRRMPSDNRAIETRRYDRGINSSERNTPRTSTYRGSNNTVYRGGNRTVHYSSRYSSNGYRQSSYAYGNRYGNVYGRRTVFMYGTHYRVIPSSFISIHFGGHPYYYNRGYFYGYYSGYYQPIFPPFGLRISVLPFGYTQFFMGVNPFFYYNGIYYRQYNDNSYEVVDAPMGATVSSLPKGARSVIINGEKLYELNGTYYKADRDSKGNDVFIVVGKNGVINNSTDAVDDLNTALPLQVGDVISQLPEGSKVVTINGEQLYETPDNIYLQQQSDNGVTEYKVIGK